MNKLTLNTRPYHTEEPVSKVQKISTQDFDTELSTALKSIEKEHPEFLTRFFQQILSMPATSHSLDHQIGLREKMQAHMTSLISAGKTIQNKVLRLWKDSQPEVLRKLTLQGTVFEIDPAIIAWTMPGIAHAAFSENSEDLEKSLEKIPAEDFKLTYDLYNDQNVDLSFYTLDSLFQLLRSQKILKNPRLITLCEQEIIKHTTPENLELLMSILKLACECHSINLLQYYLPIYHQVFEKGIEFEISVNMDSLVITLKKTIQPNDFTLLSWFREYKLPIFIELGCIEKDDLEAIIFQIKKIKKILYTPQENSIVRLILTKPQTRLNIENALMIVRLFNTGLWEYTPPNFAWQSDDRLAQEVFEVSPHLQDLRIHSQVMMSKEIIKKAFENCPNIRTLAINNNVLDDEIMDLISEKFKDLNSLAISLNTISFEKFLNILKKNHKIKNLTVQNNRNVKISRAEIIAIGQSLPSLETLTLFNIFNIEDIVNTLAIYFPKLKKLCLNSTSFDFNTLNALFARLKPETTIEIPFQTNVNLTELQQTYPHVKMNISFTPSQLTYPDNKEPQPPNFVWPNGVAIPRGFPKAPRAALKKGGPLQYAAALMGAQPKAGLVHPPQVLMGHNGIAIPYGGFPKAVPAAPKKGGPHQYAVAPMGAQPKAGLMHPPQVPMGHYGLAIPYDVTPNPIPAAPKKGGPHQYAAAPMGAQPKAGLMHPPQVPMGHYGLAIPYDVTPNPIPAAPKKGGPVQYAWPIDHPMNNLNHQP